jgi:hypothetical protein
MLMRWQQQAGFPIYSIYGSSSSSSSNNQQ